MLRFLLRKGAEKGRLGPQDCSALYCAAQFGRLAATKALLDAGADVGIRCGEIQNLAQHIVAENGHVDVTKALLDHGADVDAGRADGVTALHFSCTTSHGGVEMIDALVEAGANVRARDKDEHTPPHYAAVHTNQGAVLALFRHVAKVNAKADMGDTP